MDGTWHGGRWTRSGRGSCEIWSLHLGDLVRAQVTRGVAFPPTWSAAMNATELGVHPTREAAMQRVESAIVQRMRPAIADWVAFQVDPKRPRR
ncbi:MAG TPA: hypothetical protein VFZ03_04025 [Dongiaceae bacterium]